MIGRLHRAVVLPALLFVVAMIGTVTLYTTLAARENQALAALVSERAAGIGRQMQRQSTTDVLAINRLAQRWDVANGTPSDQWHADAANYVGQIAGLRLMEWIDADHRVHWIEPSAGHESLLGSNAEAVVADTNAMGIAAQGSKPAFGPARRLAEGFFGFKIFVPVTRLGKPDGFIAGVFEASQCLGRPLPNTVVENFALTLKQDGQTFHQTAAPHSRLLAKVKTTVPLHAYGQNWTLTVTPTAQFIARNRTPLPEALLVAGAALSLMLAFAVRATILAREREASLVKARHFNDVVIANSAHLIITTDVNGIVTLFNKAAERALGYSAREVIGKHTPALWHDPGETADKAKALSAELGRPVERGFETFTLRATLGLPEPAEWTFVRKDKTRFPVSLTVTALREPDGQIFGYLGVTEDISIRKMEEENRKLVEADLKTSEERYNLVVKGMGVGLWDWKPAEKALYWSPKFLNIIGIADLEYTPSIEKFRDLLHPDDRALSQGMLDDHLQDNRPYDVEYRLRHANGSYVWIHAHGQALYGDHGEVIRVAGSINDITPRKLAEDALRVSEEVFRSAMLAASIGMALVEPDGRWTRVNPALCDLLGYDEARFLANDASFIHPDDGEADREITERMLSGEISHYQAERRFLHSSGRTVWSLVSASAVSGPSGDLRQFIMQIQDISERKEMDRVKSEFISVVSHELRTPLTSIRGSLGLMLGTLKDEMSKEAIQFATIAHKNAERLITLINDILDIDKIAAGEMRLDMQTHDIGALAREAIAANAPYAEKFGVVVNGEGVGANIGVAVDEDRMLQVLTNLLSNAAKFSPTGSEVLVISSVADGVARLTVIDQGSGIPEEFRARIFGKFAQADPSSKRVRGGTGLGLHITQQIVHQMGGEIGFETQMGQGSSFWVQFPVLTEASTAKPSRALVPQADEASDKQTDPAVSAHLPRVLHIEDDKDMCALIERQLRGKAVVHPARTLSEAKSRLSAQAFDLILLDVALSDAQTIDRLDQLGLTRGRTPPIVVLSANVPSEDIRNASVAIFIKSKASESKVIDAIVRYAAQKEAANA